MGGGHFLPKLFFHSFDFLSFVKHKVLTWEAQEKFSCQECHSTECHHKRLLLSVQGGLWPQQTEVRSSV